MTFADTYWRNKTSLVEFLLLLQWIAEWCAILLLTYHQLPSLTMKLAEWCVS